MAPLQGLPAAMASAAGWLLWCVLIGYLGHRLPRRVLDHDTWLTRPRPWGESAASYERRLGIRRWKRWLPDAGPAFSGGLRKASLVGRDQATRERLMQETRRAELVHLGIWPFWLATALWLPAWAVAVNLVVATACNLPCLWVQRFNRIRLQERARSAGTPARDGGPASGDPPERDGWCGESWRG
jgi:glycosyl-4,4'-diaponeurosporenoate acyltransferase